MFDPFRVGIIFQLPRRQHEENPKSKSKVGWLDSRHSDLGRWTLDIGPSQLGSAAQDAAKNGAKPVVAAALVITIAGILPIALLVATHEAFTEILR